VLYHHPVFRLGEILLVGAVLFHGLNGLRVIAMDFAPSLALYQRQLLVGVGVAFFVLFAPAAAIMFAYMLQSSDLTSHVQALREWRAWLPSLVAATGVFAAYAPTLNLPRSQPSVRPAGGLEFYGWLYLRVSGVLIIFLVLGHLFIMHILDGGVNRINFDFVAQRFASPFWRVYDLLLMVLAMSHGVWGMRTVLLDYIHRPLPRLLALSALYTVAGVVVALGALVLFTFQPLK
jgi:succinate dehydrogenase / fumarate reductase membrane anchor subunit